MDIYSKYIESQNRRALQQTAAAITETPGIPKQMAAMHSASFGKSLLVKNGTVLLPDGFSKLDIIFEGGKVSSLHEHAEGSYEQEIDAAGLIVSPGIIDPHIHLGFAAPFEHELETETRSAIAGGVTTVGCMFGGEVPHSQTFPKIRDLTAQISWTDIVPHLMIHNEAQRREISMYVSDYGIRSFKLFMCGLPGFIPSASDGFMLEVLEEVKRQGGCIVCVHAENDALMTIARKTRGPESAFLAGLAEEEAISRICLYAERIGQPIYIVHVASAAGARQARKLNSPLMTAETTSPYLCAPMNRDTVRMTVMSPPMHGGEAREELWAGILDGSIKTIGTDNVTLTKKEKRMDSADLHEVMPGYPALETHLPSMLSEGMYRSVPIETILKAMTEGPAKTFGIYPKKGALTPGCDADAVIINLNTAKTVKAVNLHSRSDFSMYENQPLRGWAEIVIKGGNIVYNNGKFFDKPCSGIIFRS